MRSNFQGAIESGTPNGLIRTLQKKFFLPPPPQSSFCSCLPAFSVPVNSSSDFFFDLVLLFQGFCPSQTWYCATPSLLGLLSYWFPSLSSFLCLITSRSYMHNLSPLTFLSSMASTCRCFLCCITGLFVPSVSGLNNFQLCAAYVVVDVEHWWKTTATFSVPVSLELSGVAISEEV